jgi:hypothetical protein
MLLKKFLLLARTGVLAWACIALQAPAVSQPVVSGPLPKGITAVTSVEGISEYRLANGLQLLLVPDDSKPTTTVNLTYRVGSRHENYGETGMAHLLEHLRPQGRVRQARFALQRQYMVRPNQLFRQLRGQRRQPAVVPVLACRRDGQQLHRETGPRHRDDRRAQ